MITLDFNAPKLDHSLNLIELCQNGGMNTEELSRSRQITYEIDISKVIELCEGIGWLVNSKGNLLTTEKSLEILRLEERPKMLRRMLDMIIQSQHVYWKRFLSRGRQEAKLFLEDNQLQILRWCGLFGEGEDVSDWWLDQRDYSNDDEQGENTKTGRYGERKTISFEERRTGSRPFWTAFELGDSEGFDVLSQIDGSERSDSLRIEVKASKRDIKNATFFLTRNEWNKAISVGSHVFHLWPEVYSDSTEPMIVSVEQMEDQVPKDIGEGNWQNAEIPMAVFL